MDFAKLLLRVRGANAVTDPEVAQALRLSDTQVLRIKDLHRQNVRSLRSRLQAMLRRGWKRSTVVNSLPELTRESDQRVLSLLSSDQRERLAQLQGE